MTALSPTVPALLLGILVGCSSQVAFQPGTLCDGSADVRFLFRNIGGGQVLPGSTVLSENGFNFFIVDGRCHYWARDTVDNETREGDLTRARVYQLTNALRLGRWAELAGDYVDSLCDGPTRQYRFADQAVNVFSGCDVRKTSSDVDWLFTAATSQQTVSYAAGAAVSGPVRFVLVAEQDTSWQTWWIDNAVDWPLATDPSAIALTYEEATHYQPGASLLATGADADALRLARRTFAAKQGLGRTGGFIPTIDGAGNRFQLFVRDTIPVEDASGLLR